MKAYKSLVKYTLAKGHTVSVWDGEEWQVKRGTRYQAIVDAIESVAVAEIRIRNTEGNIIGWAQIINDLEDDETVADHTDNVFFSMWDDCVDINAYTQGQ